MTSRCPRKSDARHTAYTYDPHGNRISAAGPGGTINHTYDQANRLTAYGDTATYRYDGRGTRASKTVSGTTTALTWDDAQGLPLLLTEGTTKYVYGPGGLPLERIDAAGAVTYYHHDQVGSTRALTNNAGAVVATYTYDPYGNLTATTGTATNPFRYTGQYTDLESGLVYLRARYYDPATAQFLTRDPAEPLTREPYGYVGNNPLNATDPSGLDQCRKNADGQWQCGEDPLTQAAQTLSVGSLRSTALACAGLDAAGCAIGLLGLTAKAPLTAGASLYDLFLSDADDIRMMSHNYGPTYIQDSRVVDAAARLTDPRGSSCYSQAPAELYRFTNGWVGPWPTDRGGRRLIGPINATPVGTR